MPQDASLPESSSPLPFPKPREAGPTAGRLDALPPGGYRTPIEPSAPPGLAATPDILSLLHALRQRWASAVLLGGTLGVITGVAVWYLLTPKHTAFAHLQVLYADDPILGPRHGSSGDFKNVLKTTAEEIVSLRVIASALRRDEVKRLGFDQKEKYPTQAIKNDLQYEVKENSELLTILYQHHDPTVATTLVNAIKEAYLTDIVPTKQNERATKIKELTKVYDDKNDAIRTRKGRLKDLVGDLHSTDPRMWQFQRMEWLGDLTRARDEAGKISYLLINERATLEALEARIKAVQDRAAGVSTTPTDKAAFETALAEALDRDHEAKGHRDRMRFYQDKIDIHVENRGVRADDPGLDDYYGRVRVAKKAFDKRKEELSERVRMALARPAGPVTPTGEDPAIQRAQLQKKVDALVALETKHVAEVNRLAGKVAQIPVPGADYEQLAEEIKREEETLKAIAFRLEHEKVEMRSASRIRGFQDAELMQKETKKQVLAAGVSPLAVLGAVCMGLAWLEFRKRRVRSAGEISRGLGIRVVGAVPRMPHLERHLVGPAGESDLEGTPVMESIDAIRTRLLHEANTRSTRVVMVTSAGPGEGKTTLAAALATSLARAGRKTLLLDGDLRRPTVHELFEVAMQPGFSEVLLGEIEVAEAAQETPQENLSVIPAGQWDREVLLALARHGLEGVFERLSEEFDFVVIDSHPVLSATDSLLIGRQADAVLLAVLREVSEMPRVYAASQQLSAVGIRVLGAVVNGTSPEEVYTSPPVAVGAA